MCGLGFVLVGGTGARRVGRGGPTGVLGDCCPGADGGGLLLLGGVGL